MVHNAAAFRANTLVLAQLPA